MDLEYHLVEYLMGLEISFSIRRPMITGKDTQPYDPEKLIALTFYVPFHKPGYSIEEQGPLSRLELLNKSYAEYEKEIVEQMTNMFSVAGLMQAVSLASY